MTLDWESWLREGSLPPSKRDDPSKKKIDASQAELLGLPVALPETTGENLSASAEFGEPLPIEPFPVEPLEYTPETDLPVVRDVAHSLGAEQKAAVQQNDPPAYWQPGDSAEEPELQERAGSSESISSPVEGEFANEDAEASALPSEEMPRRESILASVSEESVLFPVSDDLAVSVHDEIERGEETNDLVSTFTIPSQPLYPLPVTSSVSEKERSNAKRSSGKKRELLPFFLVAVFLVLGGVLFFPGESFDQVLQKGDRAYELKEFENALTFYDKAVAKSPLRIEPLRGKALTFEAMGRKGEAVDAWYSCLQVDPENPDVYARLGALLFSLGSLDNALKNYQESVRIDPGNADAYFRMGAVFEAREDLSQALEAYRRAYEILPSRTDYEDAVHRAGRELEVRDEEERRHAELADEQVLLGAASLLEGAYEDAEAHFLRALDLLPDATDALLGLAESKVGKGDLDGARGAYQRLLARDPLSEKARSALLALDPESASPEKAPSSGVLSGDEIPVVSVQPESPASQDVAVLSPERSVVPEDPVHVVPSTHEPVSEDVSPTREEGSRSAEIAVVPAVPSAGDTVVEVRTSSPGKEPEKQPVAAKEQPLKKTEPLEKSRNGQIVKTTLAPKSFARPPKKTEPKRNAVVSSAFRRDEEKLLRASRSLNLSKEYSKAAEKASEALRIRQSPEALSNLGFAQIGLGNYPAAFTAYWRRLLLSPETRNPSLEPPAFLSSPFEAARWKEIPVPDPRNLPLVSRTGAFILLQRGDGGVPARILAGKEYLFEAIRINPVERDVYINLSLSYFLMRNQSEPSSIFPSASTENENENALYLALLGHALHVQKEKELAARYLNASETRASGEVLRVVRSLKALNFPDEK